jgi:hypothetical protein
MKEIISKWVDKWVFMIDIPINSAKINGSMSYIQFEIWL